MTKKQTIGPNSTINTQLTLSSIGTNNFMFPHFKQINNTFHDSNEKIKTIYAKARRGILYHTTEEAFNENKSPTESILCLSSLRIDSNDEANHIVESSVNNELNDGEELQVTSTINKETLRKAKTQKKLARLLKYVSETTVIKDYDSLIYLKDDTNNAIQNQTSFSIKGVKKAKRRKKIKPQQKFSTHLVTNEKLKITASMKKKNSATELIINNILKIGSE